MTSSSFTRRQLLEASAAIAAALAGRHRAVAGGMPQSPASATGGEWANWSRSIHCTPEQIERPASPEEVAGVVRRAAARGHTVRVAGSGHSFVPLCATEDTLVIDARMRGLIAVDEERRLATAFAGSKLYHLHRPLREAGFSTLNLPDIDRQSLAGAVATGTHGTGRELGSLSTQVAALRLVDGRGEVVELSEKRRPDLLKAAALSLGALGVLTEVTFTVLPSYRLHEKTSIAPFDETFQQLPTRIASHRHFEFFWVSDRDACLLKALDPTEDPEDWERYEDPERLVGERVGHSAAIFPSTRDTRFNEIEYSLPAESGPDCLLELRQLMLGKHRDVSWPLEYRTVAADDLYLSTAHGRASVAISAHQAAELDYRPFFADVEAIFRNHRGRPHWGKIHSLRASDLAELYGAWDRFQAARTELDPQGRFLNPYLRELLG